MVIHELILWAFDGRENVKGLIDHLQPVIKFPKIELEGGVVRICCNAS